MKLEKILKWVDDLLETSRFDDVSNNGLQIDREDREVTKVAFAVDASLESVKKAIEAKADLLIVHHGISWGGGIRTLTGGVFNVVKEAISSNLAVAAYHLPLDANKKVGNNYEIARAIGLKSLEPAFSYHGNIIGVTGVKDGYKVGVCSGGAGEFAGEAKRLGCDVFITGEASWGNVIEAQNISMPMILAGHYETELYGVQALMREMTRSLKLKTIFIER
ncbi:MAG: Nif3-like dinuclear metal center hexameric protein [Kiritimatiellae bacterium]|nr:Nif3-like dinuclear metal center hexameric protein [Kiritimatiellia bacterium]